MDEAVLIGIRYYCLPVVQYERGRRIQFEWDFAKTDANLEKHGIDFDDAVRVFEDPRAQTTDVAMPEYGEERFKTVGMVDERIIAVIYTDRGANRRLISARRSRRNERRDYDSQGPTAR